MLYLNDIKIKLTVESAANLSDNELKRILSPCVGGHLLLPLAIDYRNKGILEYSEIKDRINRAKN